MREGGHDVTGTGPVPAVFRRDGKCSPDPFAKEWIRARTEREQRVEISRVGDLVEDLDRGIDRRDELYRPLPGYPLRLEITRLASCFRQASAPRGSEVREGLIKADHPGAHDLERRAPSEKR